MDSYLAVRLMFRLQPNNWKLGVKSGVPASVRYPQPSLSRLLSHTCTHQHSAGHDTVPGTNRKSEQLHLSDNQVVLIELLPCRVPQDEV